MEYLKELIKEIRKGHYDEWAKNYIEDVNAPNEIKEEDMELDKVLNSVIDFLESRLIEKENSI